MRIYRGQENFVQLGTGAGQRRVRDKLRDFVSVKDFGVVGDGRAVVNAAMTAASANLTSATAAFTSADIGKLVTVEGAGASSATLASTIASITNSTTAVLAAAASTTTASALAVWATDETALIQAALDAHYRVYFPAAVYGATTLRLRQGSQIIGAGPATTIISRMGVGTGGAFVAMAGGEVGQKIQILDMDLYCNQIGTNNNGLDITDYAYNSYINNVRVSSASGIGLNLPSINVGVIGQVWIVNREGGGTPLALSIPNARAMVITGTALNANVISAEGRFGNGDISLAAGASRIGMIQLQVYGSFATKDLISIAANNTIIDSIYMFCSGARRDVIRIEATVQNTRIANVMNDNGNALTATNYLNDVTNAVTIPFGSTNPTIPFYSNDFVAAHWFVDDYKINFSKRVAFRYGSNVTAANDLAMPFNGNIVNVIGATQINAIATANWPAGSEIELRFGSTPTVKHNTAGGAGTARLFLAGTIDFKAEAEAILRLRYDGTQWQETGRKVPSMAGGYTPTLTNVTNVDASTAFALQYLRVGNTVTVSGKIEVDPTAAAATSVGISLPIASNFGAAEDCGGIGAAHAIAGQSGGIYADAANNRAELTYVAANTGNAAMWIHFTYQVI